MPAVSRVFPVSQNISWDRSGSVPNVSTLSVSIIEQEEVLYQQYYIQCENTSVNWLKSKGEDSSYMNNILELELQNLDSLPAGIYKAIVYIELSNADNYIRTLTSTVNLTLTGSSVAKIETDKSSYSVIFNRANNTLTGDTVVNVMNNTEAKLLQFWQPSNIFEPKNNFTDYFNLQDNLAFGIASNPDLPITGNINHQCRLLGPSAEYLSAFAIDLLILDNNGIGVTPEQLSFEVIKNTTEKTAVINIVNPLDLPYTIECSTWLNISNLAGRTSANVSVETSTASLTTGKYSGFVNVNFNGGSLVIPVDLNLKQFIQIDDDSNFCLDIEPVRFTLINELAVYVRVTMVATYIVMGESTTVTQTYVIPYINDKASFYLGKKLHSYFPRIRTHFFDVSNVELMQMINCDLTIEELNVDYASILSEKVNGLKFFPGSKPKMFPIISNFGYRKKNKSSIMMIVYANSNKLFIENTDTTRSGDQIIIGNKTINLYQFPDNFRPIHIQWENQNLVPEWFTFTGKYTISPDFNHITSKNVLNSLMEKFETTKVKKLSINTGFILRQELELIEEMIMSRHSIMKIEDKIYQCYNVTSKMVLSTSSEDIIERDLEFIIVEK